MNQPALRTLGMLGGMSWESTVPYYRHLNRAIRSARGGHHSAPLLLCSVDFAEIETLQASGDWDAAGRLLGGRAWSLANAGAEALLLCTNTMHRVADAIEGISGLPLLHVGDACGAAIQAAGLHRIGLLGTRYTMEMDFLIQRLQQSFGLQVLVPEAADRELVQRVIFDELCQGEVRASSRRSFVRIIDEMARRGAEGVLLGCTEISLLVDPAELIVPAFDSTALHAEAGARFILGELLPVKQQPALALVG